MMIPKAFQVTMLVLCVRINEHMLIRGVGFSFCMTDGMMLTDIAFQKKKKKRLMTSLSFKRQTMRTTISPWQNFSE